MSDTPGTTTTTTTTADVTKPVDVKTSDVKPEDKGDDLEALKRHNKELLAELKTKKGEVNDYKGKYDTLQAEKDAAEEKKLADQGEFKTLLEKEQLKNKNFEKQVLKAQLQAAAVKEGLIDDDLIDVIPVDKIKISTVNDSIQITGALEAVQAYKATKPHLFKAAEAPAATTTTTPPGTATGAAVSDPSSAGTTQNAIAAGVKPGSKEHKALETAYFERLSK